MIQYAYTKSLENGIPFDKSVNYIEELNNSEEAIMNVFNMQISSQVGSDNMPYAFGYVTGEPYEFVVAVYNKLKTEHKINQFQDFFQAVENFEKNTIVDKNSIRLRIDFIYENKEISSKVFSEKDYDKIVDCIKLYFLS